MGLRAWLTDFSKGDSLGLYWKLFFWRQRAKSGLLRRLCCGFAPRPLRRCGEGSDIFVSSP